MATNWPNSVQTFTNPSPGDSLSSPSHADQHTTVNDTVEALQEYAGLVLVKTQTVGSGVSSVTVTGAFSSAFRNYRIIITGGSGTNDGSIQMRLGTTTTGYYSNLAHIAYGGNSWSFLNDVNGSQFSFVGSTRTTCINLACDIYNPFAGARTVYESTYVGAKTNSITGFTAGFHDANTSFTDVTFTLEYGTVQYTPTIRIYGFNNG